MSPVSHNGSARPERIQLIDISHLPMIGYTAALDEYQYDTAPRDFQAQPPQFCHR